MSTFKKPYAEPIPKDRKLDITAIIYVVVNISNKIKFTPEAHAKLAKVPRIFLNTALKECVKWVETNNVNLIKPEQMDIIGDLRNKEKSA